MAARGRCRPAAWAAVDRRAISARPAGRFVNYHFALNYRSDRLIRRAITPLNIVVHALSAMLLWGILRRTLLLDFFAGRFRRSADPLAFAAALMWAVHPLQIETVEYVTHAPSC